MVRTILTAALFAATSISAAFAGDIASSVNADEISKHKRTPLGLYLTPADANAALQANPDIIFLDVRDPIEISFVGHAKGVDAIVPLGIVTHDFNAKSGSYKMAFNQHFLQQAKAAIAAESSDKSTPIFLICRSGGRSAKAASQLIKAGYTNVWNLVEGFEGDRDRATGARSVNGWRNAGLPWTYKIPASAGWRAPE